MFIHGTNWQCRWSMRNTVVLQWCVVNVKKWSDRFEFCEFCFLFLYIKKIKIILMLGCEGAEGGLCILIVLTFQKSISFFYIN